MGRVAAVDGYALMKFFAVVDVLYAPYLKKFR